MRLINSVIIHCSYTPPEMDIGATEIDAWHKERGFRGIGYHYVIRRDGTLEDGRNVDTMGAHAQGHNADSIGVCLVGGMRKVDENEKRPDCNFTRAQWTTLEAHIAWIRREFPGIRVFGHRDFNQLKACPCFDVRAWWDG